jgi:FixJ family two-component response regulator
MQQSGAGDRIFERINHCMIPQGCPDRLCFRFNGSGQDRIVSEISVAVVDDDTSLRNALVSLLQASDYVATGFDDAEAFLGSAEANTTHCLITDIHMPGMNGIELNRIMTKRRGSLPIIIMTALQDKTTLDEALALGPVCLLSKPFESELLLECLDKAFPGH